MERGVMLPPIGTKKDATGTSFFTVGDLPFLDAAPAAILYWDKIYAPISIRGMAPQYDSAVDHLVELGIAESFDLKSENSFSNFDIKPMIEKYSSYLKQLDARPSEVWAIMPLLPDQDATLAAQTSLYLPKSYQTVASIEVQLRSALPVPDRAVAYEDLLEFKLKRKDQIQKLHSELSQLASRYVHVMDDNKKIALALQDLHLAINELQRVYEEKWTKRTAKNLTSAFALDGILPAGVTYLAGATIDVAFLAGAGVTVVRSAITASLPNKHRDNPYSYAIEAASL